MDISILILSIILHMIIILLILSLVYYFLISKSTYISMLNLYRNYLVNYYSSIMTKKSHFISDIDNIAKSINFTPNKMLALLANLKYQTDETTQNNRIWYRYCIFTVLVLIINFIIIVICTQAYVNPEYYIMIMETILTFIIVGCIEMIFFILVASKYIPVLPSEIIVIVKDVIINGLNHNSTNSIIAYL